MFLCGIDIISKNIWAVPFKEKKGIAITNVFYKCLYDYGSTLNKF